MAQAEVALISSEDVIEAAANADQPGKTLQSIFKREDLTSNLCCREFTHLLLWGPEQNPLHPFLLTSSWLTC